MGTKRTTRNLSESRQGNQPLGTPRSRMDDARVLSDQEIEETKHLDRDASPQPFEMEPQPPANLNTETTTTDSPELTQNNQPLDTPGSRMDDARVLSDQEIEETRCLEDEALRRQFEKELQPPANFALPPGARRAVTLGGCTVVAVLGLFLVFQAAAAVDDIRALPVPFNWIAGGFALLFVGILGWLILKLTLALVRLQRNPSVNLRALQALQERRHMQELAAEHAEQAVRELRIYLENYQLDNDAHRRLRALGLTDDEWDDLRYARRSLLANDEPTPSDQWLSEFRVQFQSILDRRAEERVKQYATRVGVGTALAPKAVIDSAVVLYACVALIKDLTFIYRLRPALGQTATILTRSIAVTYLGGLSQDAGEAVADSLRSEISEYLTQALAVAATKVTEGAVNGALLWRLGKRAISFLQPVQPTD